MKKILLFLIGGFLAASLSVSCDRKTDVAVSDNPKSWKETVMAIPDNEATKKQLTLKRKVEDVFFSKTTIVDNKLNLTVGKDYFRKNDIPESYFNLVTAEIEHTNEAFDKIIREQGLDLDVAKALEEAQNNYREYLKSLPE